MTVLYKQKSRRHLAVVITVSLFSEALLSMFLFGIINTLKHVYQPTHSLVFHELPQVDHPSTG